ncbi:hypothetical protein [Rhodococcus jostii]|uniref:Uncharacterized protein n=1 Tax=Rhodococcus jostii TaxID=132919 RepID=A0A1H4VQE5_RHOJO|nr:hypothetical protein [Rhodococcus jostii]SEC82524.1 hypothetical protein SAMN04490220_2679 [Rhodococcus jostii]
MRALPITHAARLQPSRTSAARTFASGRQAERGNMPAAKTCRAA